MHLSSMPSRHLSSCWLKASDFQILEKDKVKSQFIKIFFSSSNDLVFEVNKNIQSRKEEEKCEILS